MFNFFQVVVCNRLETEKPVAFGFPSKLELKYQFLCREENRSTWMKIKTRSWTQGCLKGRNANEILKSLMTEFRIPTRVVDGYYDIQT